MSNKTKIILSVIAIVIIGLVLTKDINVNIDNPREINVSRVLITRQSSGGNDYLCTDTMTIIDRELAHGEQINAYPATVCRAQK